MQLPRAIATQMPVTIHRPASVPRSLSELQQVPMRELHIPTSGLVWTFLRPAARLPRLGIQAIRQLIQLAVPPWHRRMLPGSLRCICRPIPARVRLRWPMPLLGMQQQAKSRVLDRAHRICYCTPYSEAAPIQRPHHLPAHLQRPVRHRRPHQLRPESR